MQNLIRTRHLSCSTDKPYVYYIRDLILFHGKRHPVEMGVGEIRDYLTHFAKNRKVRKIGVKMKHILVSFLLRFRGLRQPKIAVSRADYGCFG